MLKRPAIPFPVAAPFNVATATRFWAKVSVAEPDACWPWQASRGGSGYGHAWAEIDGVRRCVDAHRLAWLITRGEVPRGQLVLHDCNNKLCCNPRHLRLGTYAENSRQAMRDGLIARKLAAPDALAVIRDREAGRMVIEIAGRCGVRAGHVRRILAGQSWAAVTGITAPAPFTVTDTGAQLVLQLEQTS